MKAITIIRKPLVTEKTTIGTEHHRYSFEVDRRADKPQIKRAIEELYNVRVISVATHIRRNPVKRTKFGYSQKPPVKRAIVKIHQDDRIELF